MESGDPVFQALDKQTPTTVSKTQEELRLAMAGMDTSPGDGGNSDQQ